MQALVTGGGGFLGRYLVRQLVATGARVRTFSRRRHALLDELDVEQITGDLRDSRAVDAAVRGVDVVFHTAAIPGIWGPWKTYYETNTLGTLHLLESVHRHRVERLVYTSSPSVTFGGRHQRRVDERASYPRRWLCHYPHSKALAELAVLQADDPRGLRTCALRPHLIWGPEDPHLVPRLIDRARRGRLRIVGDGSTRVDMVYVENAASAHLLAAKALAEGRAGGHAYFITQEAPVRCWDWINQILALAGLPPVTRRLPLPVAYAAGALLEGIYRLARRETEPPMTRFLALQLGRDHFFCTNAARRDLGYRPAITTEQGMERLGAWLQSGPLARRAGNG